MTTVYRQRHREYTGPTPHNVAIVARPPNLKPPEHLILERRRVEDLREKSIIETKYNEKCDLKSAWERATDKQIQKNVIKRQMKIHLQKDRINLEERRQRLREKLISEEEQYLVEMESMEETIEERQQKMKERAKFLKEKREAERLATVEDKLDQRFRGECEELRAELSKRTRDEIFKDREAQLQLKASATQRQQEHEAFYAKLWEEDIQAKSKREELETIEQIERNREMLNVLNLQKRAIDVKREDEERKLQMEAEWLKEEKRMRDEEERQLKAQKMEKQKQAKRARDISKQLKEKKLEKEKQEQLAMDMKTVKEVQDKTRDAMKEEIERKRRDNEEMKRFMVYVDETKKEEQRKEKLLQDAINEEVEEKWQAKDRKKQLEKEARKALMHHVLDTRKKQIKEEAEQRLREQEAEEQERQELMKQIEEHRQLEREKMDRVLRDNKQYQNDLKSQINYQRHLMSNEINDAKKELVEVAEAEREYKRKLQEALSRQDRRKAHPLRATTGLTIVGRSSPMRAKSS